MLIDRWLDAMDNIVHAVGKKLSVLALASMLTANRLICTTNYFGVSLLVFMKCSLVSSARLNCARNVFLMYQKATN